MPCSQLRHLANQPRQRGLADTAGAGEEIGVVQAVAFERIDQRAQHMLLTDHLREGLRAPASREYLV